MRRDTKSPFTPQKSGADALAFTITSFFSMCSAVSLAMDINCKSHLINRTIQIPAFKSPSPFLNSGKTNEINLVPQSKSIDTTGCKIVYLLHRPKSAQNSGALSPE